MLTANSVTGTAAVIGAGTMGGGIAAQLANAGWRVMLFDVAGDTANRNAAAVAGIERIAKSKPPLLYRATFADRILPCNIEDDAVRLADADWIVEAVVEKMDIKRAVLAMLEEWARADAILTTNTSGLSLQEMTEGRGPEFRRRFFGTHFFNPPRYLKLLEVIVLPETDGELLKAFGAFAERVLGRRIVAARDTPGFISNRIGMWTLLDSIHAAIEMGMTVDEVDYLTGPLIGRPRSATMRLADIIGFDIISDVAANQYARLPEDPYRDRLILPEAMQRLIADGRKGEKTGAGFFKRAGKDILALDFQTLDYRPRTEVRIEEIEALRKLPLADRFKRISGQTEFKWALYLNRILNSLTTYVRHASPEIADDVLAVDRVMMWGFNWEMGPFEVADHMSHHTAAMHRHYSGEVPTRRYRVFGEEALREVMTEPHYFRLEYLVATGKVIEESDVSALIDLDDGAACFTLKTKMGTFNPQVTEMLVAAIDRCERDFSALVIGHQGGHFSAGYDLRVFLDSARSGDTARIDAELAALQRAFSRMKYARIPVVGTPFGNTLGGGAECILHAAAVQASAELTIGLPETSVGVIPAGGGCVELLSRAMTRAVGSNDPFPHVEGVFDLIVRNTKSGSAHEAKSLGFLRETDGISVNADRLLFDAKQRALGMAHSGYTPPEQKGVWALGEETTARMRMPIHWHYRSGVISEFDLEIAERLTYVLSGGNLPFAQEVSADYLHRLEREAFLALLENPLSVARMQHMLDTGKALRN